ncbi:MULTISPECIES: N-acetylmuramoyl-L-alanine amidase [Paenibacillus]|uniref:N-acetylmuramoyl-L-alanine amidase n=2 Tax=Paenibacillus TaxID=44249 RepID=A0ABU3RD89_9BACL|nr:MULTISPECIES: N-acetylmuramoyl-L-alanine amidase [Paenibacillus]MCY9658534.1 N-acetylmuramoyl-L-alanine amidase [Paenibacillus anseongense]MDU0202262.1 N-acetylmuramoyl-L-alanine amidase [Paenibacillus sp. PFR10]MEB4796241.1 N-acetylmuramoyl-L-alanine amidase [Paenibacillus chondroitinus]MEC0264707.1 N-acetylmuramoyl-L-alanine amidase [Paenibacillus anseongense]
MISVEDANKIIAFLSAAYMATEDPQARDEFHRLANELRKASGQPTQ